MKASALIPARCPLRSGQNLPRENCRVEFAATDRNDKHARRLRARADILAAPPGDNKSDLWDEAGYCSSGRRALAKLRSPATICWISAQPSFWLRKCRHALTANFRGAKP